MNLCFQLIEHRDDDDADSVQTNGVILVEKCIHISTFIGHKLLKHKTIIARLIRYPELERKLIIKTNFEQVNGVCVCVYASFF